MLLNLRFESCVVLDGSQTFWGCGYAGALFESCVVLDGSQTKGENMERVLSV